MGILKKRRDFLTENYGDDVILFDNPSFDSAIIGVTHDNRAVYDYDEMIDSLAKEYMAEGETTEEAVTMAIEWIEFNTLRSLPYVSNGPVVVFNTEDMFEDEENE